MKKYIRLKYIGNLLLILAQFLLLLYPAIQNGYPLLYSDSATYIISGFDVYVPIDRPIAYGFFIRLLSLSLSLWPVIIAQALMVILLSYSTFSVFIKSKYTIIYSSITVILLSVLTGLSNYVSQIMPDIFAGILIWSVALFMLTHKRKAQVLLSFVIILCSIVHFSNLLTLTLIAIFIALFVLIVKRWRSYRIVCIRLLLLIGICYILLPSINFFVTGEFFISKSGKIFFMARLIDNGIARDYLNENCESKDYALCKYKDKLPDHAWQFLWLEESPLYEGDCDATGHWPNCWIEKQEEYGTIIKEVLTSPRYLKDFITIGFSEFLKQLNDFKISQLTKQGESSIFTSVIEKYFEDQQMFIQSNQYDKALEFKTQSKIQDVTIYTSSVLIVALALGFIIGKVKLREPIKIFMYTLVAGLFINAANCTFLASVLNRYQGRIIWLVPLIVLLILFITFDKRMTKNKELSL